MPRWSKLQKQLYQFIAPELNFQIHCSVNRQKVKDEQDRSVRYWITLNKKIIWDFPKHFMAHPAPLRPRPSDAHIPDISDMIREYMDTPKNELAKLAFEEDHWGLIDILKAADRRIGKRQFAKLYLSVETEPARQILAQRMTNAGMRIPEIQKQASFSADILSSSVKTEEPPQ